MNPPNKYFLNLVNISVFHVIVRQFPECAAATLVWFLSIRNDFCGKQANRYMRKKSEDLLERMLKNMSERMSEDMSNAMSEDLSEHM